MRARESRPDVVWSGGVRVAGTRIWCDAQRAEGLCFVSHAHLPLAWRTGTQARVVATQRTLALRAAIDRTPPRDVLVAPFGRPFALGRLRLELLPSGHVPGAAQLLVERPDRRVLYAGDVNPTGGRTTEPAQVRGCDALVLEAPLAPLLRALPPRDEVEAALVEAVRRALEAGRVPIVLAPALGGAGEVAALFESTELPYRAHRRIASLLSADPDQAAHARSYRPPARAGEALLWPLDAAPPRLAVPSVRLAVSGEALAPGFAERLGAEQAFALADHGDLPSLVRFAESTEARDVYFTRGLTDEVARALAGRSRRVHPLAPPAQGRLFP